MCKTKTLNAKRTEQNYVNLKNLLRLSTSESYHSTFPKQEQAAVSSSFRKYQDEQELP